jgi:hypothetical protein
MKIGSLNLSGLFVFLLLAVTTASCGEPENAKGEIRERDGSSEGLQGVNSGHYADLPRGTARCFHGFEGQRVCQRAGTRRRFPFVGAHI